MWLKMPSILVPIWAKVHFCVEIRFIKPRVFSDLILKKVKDFSVNRLKIGKNILGGISGSRGWRGRSPVWGWGAPGGGRGCG